MAAMMRNVPEAQYCLMKLARDRDRDGRLTYVLNHEVVLTEDRTAAMVFVYFGSPGDDPGKEVDVGDIVAVFYDLDAPVDTFDAQAAAAAFVPVVQSINNKTAFRVH
jgi:hypothetical protein